MALCPNDVCFCMAHKLGRVFTFYLIDWTFKFEIIADLHAIIVCASIITQKKLDTLVLSKLKLVCVSEKATHRTGENNCKSHDW